ncbi:uncharacterized protein BDV17DRAFT_272985 [Aspergillus undulatus]|uniref:uncharacterized protein n=1 Tax=Aspergillus undulatus TaxID=1810928 RepID=UPI003CCDA36E
MGLAKRSQILQRSDSSPIWSMSRLPSVIHDRIYMYAIPKARSKQFLPKLGGLALSRGIGDSSGFYYTFSSLGLLAVNKQMCEEALGLAYGKSFIQMEDMDHFIAFATSVEKIGHGDIESMGFTWENRSDTTSTGCGVWNPGDETIKLPTLHTKRCIQLLEHFRRLRCLQLWLEDGVMSSRMTPESANSVLSEGDM